jgi:hypothetical protein
MIVGKCVYITRKTRLLSRLILEVSIISLAMLRDPPVEVFRTGGMGAEGDTDVGVVQTGNPDAANGPRRTLTDDDRRQMCIYHEENKTAKQTDIGGKHYLRR